MNARMPRLAMATALAAAIVLLPACRKAQEKAQEAAIEAAMEKATGAKVDIDKDGNTMTVKTAQGEMKIATAGDGADMALPAGFPKDVYLPPEYRVESAMEMPNALVAHLLAPGTLGAIVGDADKAMKAQGWTEQMALVDSPQAHIATWEKGGRHATLTLAGDAAHGGVQVGYQLASARP